MDWKKKQLTGPFFPLASTAGKAMFLKSIKIFLDWKKNNLLITPNPIGFLQGEPKQCPRPGWPADTFPSALFWGEQLIFSLPSCYNLGKSAFSPHGGARHQQVQSHKMEYITWSHMQQWLIIAQLLFLTFWGGKDICLGVSLANRFLPVI